MLQSRLSDRRELVSLFMGKIDVIWESFGKLSERNLIKQATFEYFPKYIYYLLF